MIGTCVTDCVISELLFVQYIHAIVDFLYFFLNDTATTEIYTFSLHDALPISARRRPGGRERYPGAGTHRGAARHALRRSEEHTSELQSPDHLVCRLLLEKKKKYLLFLLCSLVNYSYIYGRDFIYCRSSLVYCL